jgi:hypothetical protein
VKSVAPRPLANSVVGTDCRYNGRNPLWFRIYYDGSANDATTLFAKLKVFYSPNTPASGIGDEAYFDKEGALHVRKDNVRFYLKEAFNVPVGDKFNHTAIGQGLERLRQLYGDHGYINFTAVPTLQLDKDRATVVVTISMDDGQQFTFGRLFLAGQETRPGEADALHTLGRLCQVNDTIRHSCVSG